MKIGRANESLTAETDTSGRVRENQPVYGSLISEQIPDQVCEIHAHLTNLLVKFYPQIDREEVKQELWMAFFGSTYHQDGPTDDEETDLRQLRRQMRRGAERYCRTEKAAAAGYESHDESFYSKRALRLLLESWFAHGPSESPARSYEDSVSRSGGGDASQSGDWLVSLIDVGESVKKLKPAQQEILYYAYSPNYAGRTDAEIAMELRSRGWQQMTVTKFQAKVRWALNRLQRQLGGNNPWK